VTIVGVNLDRRWFRASASISACSLYSEMYAT